MPRAAAPRVFPVGPLLAIVARPAVTRTESRDRSEWQALADALPEPMRRNVWRWKAQDGHLTEDQADRAACALDLHPLLIWPDEWGATLARPATPTRTTRTNQETNQ